MLKREWKFRDLWIAILCLLKQWPFDWAVFLVFPPLGRAAVCVGARGVWEAVKRLREGDCLGLCLWTGLLHICLTEHEATRATVQPQSHPQAEQVFANACVCVLSSSSCQYLSRAIGCEGLALPFTSTCGAPQRNAAVLVCQSLRGGMSAFFICICSQANHILTPGPLLVP